MIWTSRRSIRGDEVIEGRGPRVKGEGSGSPTCIKKEGGRMKSKMLTEIVQ